MGTLSLSFVIGIVIVAAILIIWLGMLGVPYFDGPDEPNKGYISCSWRYTKEQIKEMEAKIEAKYQEDLKVYEKEKKKVAKKKRSYYISRISICVAIVLVFMVGGYLGISYGFSTSAQYHLVGYEAQKTTIEQSLQSDTLSGMERFELVKQASELNKWLAQKQFDYSKWYNFDLYDSVKEMYKNAECINLDM